jgi:hypothetical protein
VTTQTNTIYEELIVRDAQANAALSRISNKVTGVHKAITGLKGALRFAAGGAMEQVGIAGMFGFVNAIKGTEALYEKIGRIKAVTGLAAAEAHGLVDAFELTGNENAEATVTRLARLQQLARGGSKQASELRHQLGRVGVAFKGTTTDTLLSMSKAVQGGKLGVAGLAKVFKIPLNQAADLLKSLQKGPQHLKALVAESKAGADSVNDGALASFEQMMQARREMRDAWEGLVGTLYKKMLPGATKFVHALTTGLESAIPVAEAVGSILSNHMGLVVTAAKAYLGYLVAAKAVGFFGGDFGGMIKGAGRGILTGPWTRAPKAAAIAPWSQRFAAGASSALTSMQIGSQFAGRGRFAAAAGGFAQMLGGWSPTLGRLAASTVSIRALGAVLGRLGPVGLALAVGVKAFQILKNDIGGHRTRIAAVLSSIADKFQGIAKTMKPVLNLMQRVFGEALTIVARYWLYVLEYWLKAVNGFLRIVKAIAYFIGDLVTTKPWNWGTSMWTRAWSKAGESIADEVEGKGKKTAPGAKPDGIYQDFRGSKFDITQKFAEGFDPGRVSVAFTEDIARVGEKRLQSGFAPAFAVRGLR